MSNGPEKQRHTVIEEVLTTGEDAPSCSAPDPAPRTPQLRLPSHSCDCHAHICGPRSVYPYVRERIYTPPDALLPDYLKVLSRLGVERAVLVQPSVYGTDNTVMLEAMARSPIPCRGVAVLEPSVSDDELERLDASGVRGLRFNVVDVAGGGARFPGDEIRAFCERISRLGWHAEFLMHVNDYPNLDRMLENWPVEVVFGHMGYMQPGCSMANPGFASLKAMLRKGRCWVKLTAPYRLSETEFPYADVLRIARVLVSVAPERVIWGTDWPHVVVTKAMPNHGDLCDLLSDWIPDADVRERVLGQNPCVLYGFDAP